MADTEQYLRAMGAARRLGQERTRLQAEVERLEADARRYAYIRDCLVQTHSHHMDGTCGYRVRAIYGRAGTFDKLIDGKIAEAEAEGYDPTPADAGEEE